MTDRLPPIPPALWTAEQRRYAREIIEGPRKALISPFVPMLRSPELMAHSQRLGEYLRYRSSIGLRLSELAILVTANHWGQAVEWHIHAPIAEREGIAAEAIAAIAAGEPPRGLNPDESVVYAFSRALHEDRSVSADAWQKAVDLLGEQGVVDLIAINGYYAYLAMLMNAACTPLPDLQAPS